MGLICPVLSGVVEQLSTSAPQQLWAVDLLTKAGLSYMEVTWKNRMLFPSMLCVSPVHEQILAVHIQRRSLPLAEDVSVASIASSTTGFTGADLANLVNEAALLGGARQQGCAHPLLPAPACQYRLLVPRQEDAAHSHHFWATTCRGRLTLFMCMTRVLRQGVSVCSCRHDVWMHTDGAVVERPMHLQDVGHEESSLAHALMLTLGRF